MRITKDTLKRLPTPTDGKPKAHFCDAKDPPGFGVKAHPTRDDVARKGFSEVLGDPDDSSQH